MDFNRTQKRGQEEAQMMKPSVALLALVLSLLAWTPDATAVFKSLGKVPNYDLDTPAPEGRRSCSVTIIGSKPTDRAAKLLIGLGVAEGEVQIASLGIGEGEQRGCDIFRNGPHSRTMNLDSGEGVFEFDLTLEVHAHPDSNCALGGVAIGHVGASIGLQLDKSENINDFVTLDISLTCP